MTRVTPAPRLPRHGTVQRYRLELKAKRDEKGAGPCDRCRAANSKRVKASREARAKKPQRPHLTLVGDVTSETAEVTPADHTDVDTPPDAETPTTEDRKRRIRAMQKAVQEDIDDIDENLRVPFHRSLSVLAIELAQEIDEPATAATARRDARKQLFEVLRSLRTQKEGDDGSALAVLLEERGFGTPLVPGRRA